MPGEQTPVRLLLIGLALVASLALAACTHAQVSSSHRSHGHGFDVLTARRDPRSAHRLLVIARAFSDAFQQNRGAWVYGRWDAGSRSIITEAAYVRRHQECPNDPKTPVDTWAVSRGPGGAWLVHYSVGGQQLIDWWYYVDGRFVFDLARSNPSAVALYRAPPARYLQLAGCES